MTVVKRLYFNRMKCNLFCLKTLVIEIDRCLTDKYIVKMKRVAFKMFLKPGFEKEYEKRHREIWPEVAKMIKDSGVYDYSIFWDRDTNILFAVQKTLEDAGSQDLGTEKIIQEWWDYMKDIMETNPDNSPISIPLKEVFYLE